MDLRFVQHKVDPSADIYFPFSTIVLHDPVIRRAERVTLIGDLVQFITYKGDCP